VNGVSCSTYSCSIARSCFWNGGYPLVNCVRHALTAPLSSPVSFYCRAGRGNDRGLRLRCGQMESSFGKSSSTSQSAQTTAVSMVFGPRGTPHIFQEGRTSATSPLDTCVLIVVHEKDDEVSHKRLQFGIVLTTSYTPDSRAQPRCGTRLWRGTAMNFKALTTTMKFRRFIPSESLSTPSLLCRFRHLANTQP